MDTKISTWENITTEKPTYSGGVICHCFERLPADETKTAEGGMRLAGKYKRSQPGKPLVTFITVVWNNKKTLHKCMESVWAQTYDNVEYIILDGVSTDGTLELIEEHADKIDYYISQKDHGIYDAMNRALSVASGDVITLINSDDWADPVAAAEAARMFNREAYDLLGGVGRVYQENGDLAFVWNPRDINCGTIFYGVPMLHQAVYISRNCYEKVGNLDHQCAIAADYKQMLAIYFAGCKICRSDAVFAHFMLGGASADKAVDLKERIALISSYFPFLTADEALHLHQSLDVTIFWNSLNEPEDKTAVKEILEKYADQPLLLRAISEALLARYEEIKKLYLTQKCLPMAVTEKPKNCLKKLVNFFD